MEISWYVHKYGKLYTEYEININRVTVKVRVLVYDTKFYCELWQDNYLCYFGEVLDSCT